MLRYCLQKKKKVGFFCCCSVVDLGLKKQTLKTPEHDQNRNQLHVLTPLQRWYGVLHVPWLCRWVKMSFERLKKAVLIFHSDSEMWKMNALCLWVSLNVFATMPLCVSGGVCLSACTWQLLISLAKRELWPSRGGWERPTRDRWLPVCPRSTYTHRPHVVQLPQREWERLIVGLSTVSHLHRGGCPCHKAWDTVIISRCL